MVISKEKLTELLSAIQLVKIIDLKKHEGADRLTIVQVQAKDGQHQIVTAATNMNIGDIVAWLAPGNVVPGVLIFENNEIKLDARKMRGEMSEGMILAEDEFALSHDHEGIFIVTNDEARNSRPEDLIGKSILDVLTDEQMKQIERNAGIIEITPELQHRIDLIKSIAANGGELVGEDELPLVLTSGEELFTYDGFEPSGQMHIAQGIIRAINANKMIEAGFHFKMWVADWFGYLNNKMGGDLDKIKKVGEYFIEIWRASGMDLNGVEFLWTSDFVGKREYWELVMKVAKSATLNRILRTTEIMGRTESDDLTAAQILYPCMQTADIFGVMKCQVTQLGLDQRKVNMLAREIGPELGFWKPIVLSHSMLQGLGKPADKSEDAQTRAISMKMSKSKPDTAIFMTDTLEDIERKINKAYCPEGEVEDNPILDYCKQIIFEAKYLKRKTPLLEDDKFKVTREEKFGGNVEYSTYAELEQDYKDKKLFPLDLKVAVINYIDELVKPVRLHFETDEKAKAILEEVKSFSVTR
ncbi:MAG: tyrosine--tRNA ligase [Candidatus Dojkabacteria bacterium]